MYVLRAIFYLLLIIFLLPVQLQTSDLKSPIPDEQQSIDFLYIVRALTNNNASVLYKDILKSGAL